MTREDVLAMEPGRELDALVAEKVMGFENLRFGRNDPTSVWVGDKRKFMPSRDISAAWEVVEKLNNRSLTLNIYKTPQMCIAYVSTNAGLHKSEAGTETAPEAISKAALLAVMDA